MVDVTRGVLLLEKERIRTVEADTLKQAFEDWYKKVLGKTKPAHVQINRSFEIHVFPSYGKHPSMEVTLHHWLDLLEELAAKVPCIAEVILTNAKQMLKWAVKRKRLPGLLADGRIARHVLPSQGCEAHPWRQMGRLFGVASR